MIGKKMNQKQSLDQNPIFSSDYANTTATENCFHALHQSAGP